MRRKSTKTLSTQRDVNSLVNDFLSALTNNITAETAQYAAEQSEQDTLQTIIASGSARIGGYVTPQDIPVDTQQLLVKSSLDAHVKKVQADQVKQLAAGQLKQMQSDNESVYVGKKVRIIIVDQSCDPVESFWFNDKTGQQNVGSVKRGVITGRIRKIELVKNLLIIEPTLVARLLNPARKYYLVYPINPQTLTPAVQIKLL